MEIPEGVEIIKSYSCANFGFIELTIPSSVHTIEEHAFINEMVNVFIGLENAFIGKDYVGGLYEKNLHVCIDVFTMYHSCRLL